MLRGQVICPESYDKEEAKARCKPRQFSPRGVLRVCRGTKQGEKEIQESRKNKMDLNKQ